MLKTWIRRSKIVLESNPEYRGYVWDFAASDPAWDDALVKDMRGKKMPQIGRVEITIIEEAQSRWLAFEQKELDYIAVPDDLRAHRRSTATSSSRASRSRASASTGCRTPSITYTAFNIRDPVIGGFAKDKIALRRAMAMAYDIDEEIKVVRKGQAVALQMPIPAGVVGHDPNYRSINQYDPVLANKLLDYFGYGKGQGRLSDAARRQAARRSGSRPSRSSTQSRARRAVGEVARGDRHPYGVGGRASSSTTCRRRRRASCRCGGRAGSPTIPTATTSCSCSTVRTRARATRLLRVEGVRRVLRALANAAQFARAQPAVPRHDAADGGRRRVEPACCARCATS